MLLSFSQLATRLGITRPRLSALVKAGLPMAAESGRVKRFDFVAVGRWVLASPVASDLDPVCVNYAELAKVIGMETRFPDRMICKWTNQADFPGRAGSSGKSDAHLPARAILEWCRAHKIKYAGLDGDGGPGDGDDLRAIRKRVALLQAERDELNLRKQLGQLADIEEVAAFNRRCIANAKACLEPLADIVRSELPRELGPEKERIHGIVTKLLADALNQLADMVAGDGDEAFDDDEVPVKAGGG